jgi:E3 ubiquitin-protein ligase HUWE1
MKLYSLKTLPYDLANTSAFFTLSHLIKLLAETNPSIAIIAVVGEVQKHLDVVAPLLDSVSSGSDLAKYIDVTSKLHLDMFDLDYLNFIYRQ